MSANAYTPPAPLCAADPATFWPWFSHAQFTALPDKDNRVVVLPLVGMADWGLGHPLDAEEWVLMHVIRDASLLAKEGRKPLVVPPLRFVLGPDPSCAFAVDAPTAHALVAEVAASVAAAGFRKIVILNSSPWSEEFCSAATRDLRVGRGLHMFTVHLSALGLDFHPVRSRSRRSLQTLVTALTGTEPEPGPPEGPAETHAWGDESVRPLPGPALRLAEARIEGAALLSAAAQKLAGLFSDIGDRPALVAKLIPV
jgi:hypothetical protein